MKKVTFSAFIGYGQYTSFDIKIKENGRIVSRIERSFTPKEYACDLLTELESYFQDFVFVIHKAGYQKLASEFERKIKFFDDEYGATWLHDAISFTQRLNFASYDVDPVL